MLDVPPFVVPDLERIGITLSSEQLQKLAHYLSLMLEVNQRFNLTSIRQPDEAWRRHIIDSLTALPGFDGLPEGSKVIDVGTGGGLPGIPLAIARPDLSFTLLESTGKKVRFLEQCIAEIPLPNVRAIQERAEVVGQDAAHRQHYDAAICRALGPMSPILEYTLPLVKVEGMMLAMKGPSVEAELEQAGDAILTLGGGEVEVVEAYPESFGIRTVIVIVHKARPTPKTYPRATGLPLQSPL